MYTSPFSLKETDFTGLVVRNEQSYIKQRYNVSFTFPLPAKHAFLHFGIKWHKIDSHKLNIYAENSMPTLMAVIKTSSKSLKALIFHFSARTSLDTISSFSTRRCEISSGYLPLLYSLLKNNMCYVKISLII